MEWKSSANRNPSLCNNSVLLYMFCTQSSWKSRETESLSSGFLQREDYSYLGRSLAPTPPPASRCPNDWCRFFPTALLHYAKPDKLCNSKTRESSAYLSPWLFSVQEHERSWKWGVHTITGYGPWLQVLITELLITELLIRNQEVISPPEKDEERCQRVRAKEYNLLTSQRRDRTAEESNRTESCPV